MSGDHQFELRLPRKIKPKHIAIIVFFTIFLYIMTDTLVTVFTRGLEKSDLASIVSLALILLVISVVAIYALHAFAGENQK